MTAEPPGAPLPRPGDMIAGKYVLDRLLGQGGMGAVFAAKHIKLSKAVAIKIMLADASNPEAAQRFVNEGRAAANIQNEHVVRVDDVDEEMGYAYMVLELLDGEDLSQLLEREPARKLPPHVVVGYVLQAIRGVAQAHAIGIVHRDLKPSNLFLARRKDGSVVVKVLDFGISKAQGSSALAASPSALTSTKAMLGSPLYMSPEQLRSSKSVDHRADIWALGIILYELITGTLPFMGDNLGELFAAILETDPAPLRSRAENVPPGLDEVVMRCLARKPEHRWQSAVELGNALTPFAHPGGQFPMTMPISPPNLGGTAMLGAGSSTPGFGTNGEVVGVLNVESKRKHFFNMSQADFLKNLGGHAMISIENNRLLEELRYQIDILTSLRELSLVLSSAVDIDSVAHAVLQAANQMLGSQCAALFRYDYVTKELTLLQKADQNHADHPQEKLDVLLQTVREAATTSETKLIEDVAQHYAEQLTGDAPYASIMATPIIREGLVNEVLIVGFDERQQFEVRDVTTLTLLGSQAAGHLENAALLEKISEGNNRMKAILDSTRDGIILLDERGKLIEVNPAAQRLMGIPLGEYIDQPFVDTLLRHAESDQETPGGYPREELLKLARIQRLDPEAPTRREFTRKVLPNQALYIQESGSQVVDEHRQNAGRLLVLRDITDEKLVEVYREEITSMAVHDLRSPLASIIDALRIAVENLDKPGGIAIGTQTINLALVNADKLMSLVNSLLELRRSRQMELSRSIVPVEQLVDAARDTLASTAEKAHIPVEVHMPAGLPLVNVDADKIRRVLINLLDNALRYTPAGKPVQVWVIPDNLRGKLTVQVADSGPGIPDKERERVFEQFWQVKENRPVRGTKGNGIGLTFCQRVMEAHGERIWVEAHGPLPGACFAFTLPIQPTIEPS